jgi:hypothetical protein
VSDEAFELWVPHLLGDATVALHDTFVLPGPERVVRELMIETGRVTSFVHAETTTAARRCEQLGLRETFARRVGLVRRFLYGIRLRAYDETPADTHAFAMPSTAGEENLFRRPSLLCSRESPCRLRSTATSPAA